ncbi:Endoglucanase EG-II [Recurvomyces mirabilis]|nr:Endoglucanase EG-II [Recurvomyces mirabilis]
MYHVKTLVTLAAVVMLGVDGAQKVQRAGVNIAGFDFGMTTDGNFTQSQMVPPLKSQGGPDGIGQMQHFAKDDGLNIFRLPVAWQYLVNYKLGGSLDSNNMNVYNELVQGCLGTGALCIIDIHNYARWYQGIVGQGGVTNQDLTSLWSQLASKYKGNSNIVFGLMNEPHDLNINTWATTVQACVTAIRQAGATSQIILLPGDHFTAVGGFSTGSGPALVGVHNLDGSKTNLVFDVH